MKYRYIYKITCTAGTFKNKFYFGQHTTNNLDDGYKGSGKLINDYYKKHPNDFIKEKISFHNSQEELNQAEYDIIHPWLGNEMCLNISEGGMGGGHSGWNHTEESKQLISEHRKDKCTGENNCNYGKLKGKDNPMYDHHQAEESKQLISEHRKGIARKKSSSQKQSVSLKKYYETHDVWNKGKTCSEETKQKCREATSKKRWLTKENEKPIYIDVNKVEYYLSLGYHRGRK